MMPPFLPPMITQPRPLPRPIRQVGAPLGAIIALGVITGLLVLLLTAANPVGAITGFVLSSVVMSLVLLAYLWLDRWEPEPPRLLLLAFGWGSSIAVLLSLTLEVLGQSLFAATPLLSEGFDAAAIRAPLIEEAAKGAFLLIMLTGRRRNELNSLTDCMVYAGITATGFSWLEDIEYIAGADTPGKTVATAVMRLIMAPFAHPLFTTMTGIGVYCALRLRNPAAKTGAILLGYLAAVALHATWNGSLLLGVTTYLAVYLFWMVPVFVLVVMTAVLSRRREQRMVAGKLPGMVAGGLVTANEATWLGSLRTRKSAIREATRIGGRPVGKAVARFAAAVVELAFVRDRIESGSADQRVHQLQQEQMYAVAGARYSAPVLQWLANYRAPMPPR